jgi:hypothetical protein
MSILYRLGTRCRRTKQRVKKDKVKQTTKRVPLHTEKQKFWLIENKDLIFKDKKLCIQVFCSFFKGVKLHNARQTVEYYEMLLSKSDDTPAINYVPKESEIVPAWNAPRLIEPCRPVEHVIIDGKEKVIVTYPSKINFNTE